MVNLSNYIVEKLKINKDTKQVYHYHPKNYDELENLIKKLLEERGKDADLNDIDVSEVTEMWELFYHLDPHNINISKWDVSNVTAFTRMFLNCKNFNCDLSEWNMSNARSKKLRRQSTRGQWSFRIPRSSTGSTILSNRRTNGRYGIR